MNRSNWRDDWFENEDDKRVRPRVKEDTENEDIIENSQERV